MSGDLVFLRGGYIPDNVKHVDKYFDDYYTLHFINSGAVEVWYDTQRHSLDGAWFWTCAPGPHIRCGPAPPLTRWSPYYVAFAGSLVHRWKAENLWLERPQAAPAGKDYVELFNRVIDQSRRSDHWSVMRAGNYIENILIDLAQARAQAASREPWLESVLHQLDAEQNFTPDYERIAQTCGMALSTLRRRFRESTGAPLHGYVLRRRMAAARQLLAETDLPVKAIAEQLGYGDVYFFSSQFRRHSGMAPAAYRRGWHL